MDRSFITDLLGDARDACIVNAVVNLGRALGLQVIAECVETEAQRQFLLRSGCHDFQEFLFAPALVATDFGALLPPPADHRAVALHRHRAGEGHDFPAAASGD
nr:EAL domain-containing protein [uncultured Piscinibacter sp.]